jgi:hypothetical protein
VAPISRAKPALGKIGTLPEVGKKKPRHRRNKYLTEKHPPVEYSSPELEVLNDAIRLERAGIDYMLTGSIALSYYAQPRMTRDIDFVVELSGRDAKSIAALFAPSYYVAEAGGRPVRAHGAGGARSCLHGDVRYGASPRERVDAGGP